MPIIANKLFPYLHQQKLLFNSNIQHLLLFNSFTNTSGSNTNESLAIKITRIKQYLFNFNLSIMKVFYISF